MADMGPYLAEKYTKMIEAITNDLGRTADKLALAQNILRALNNPDMMVDGADKIAHIYHNGSAVIDDQHICHLYDPDLVYG